jgi:CRP/FNR family transcriptional regulator
VAQALLTLKERFGVTHEGYIDIVLSRQDLASFAGTTYETVFRIMNDLTNDDVIAVTGKNITIIDPEKLVRLTTESTINTPQLKE